MIRHFRSPLAVLGLILGGLVLGAIALGTAIFERIYADRVYPGVYVAVSALRADLSGQTRDDAATSLAAQYERASRSPIVLRYQGKEWQIAPRDLGARVDLQTTIQAAFDIGRTAGLPSRIGAQLAGLREGIAVPPPRVHVDTERIVSYLNTIARDVDQPPTNADMALRPDQSVVVLPSRPGKKVNVQRNVEQIKAAIEALNAGPLTLVVDDVAPPLAEGDLAEVRALAERIASAPLELSATVDGTERRWLLSREEVARLLDLKASRTNPPSFDVLINEERVREQVERIARDIERPAQDARFAIDRGAVQVIQPSQEGRRIEVTASIERIRTALLTGDRRVVIPWQPVRPRYPESDAPLLAFPDMIERASTAYGGTLPERMHNVELATSRLTGVVVAPGDTFSFNEAVGEVSYRSGYKRGYGITQDGDDVLTIPSEGGGICQVATTLFQSVFWAGYPIVERNWHLYWIPRYGQAPRGLKGLDATIDQVYDKENTLLYSIDLRWRNNTEAPILIVAGTDGKNLTVTLWGRKPAWQVKVADPKIDKIVKADTKAVRQADPTLPAGAEVMIEHAEDGFQSTIVRTVFVDGKLFDETRLVSTYRPSRNVYLVGGSAPRSSPDVGRADDRPATPVAPTGTPSLVTPLPTVEPLPPAAPMTVTPSPAAAGAPSATAPAGSPTSGAAPANARTPSPVAGSSAASVTPTARTPAASPTRAPGSPTPRSAAATATPRAMPPR